MSLKQWFSYAPLEVLAHHYGAPVHAITMRPTKDVVSFPKA